jgi:hypothetical protein
MAVYMKLTQLAGSLANINDYAINGTALPML